jgi:hypothetical protein
MKFLRVQIQRWPQPIQKVLEYMFKAYIAWSICADFIIISGLVYIIFF